MKQFAWRELNEARRFALNGGQSLHVHSLTQGHPLFSRYSEIAHLFDQDKERLVATVKSLGVNVIKVEHEGTPSQHVDLCGKPFERAKKQCLRDATISKAVPFDQLEMNF